jgi:hypothetical protein
VIGIQPAVIKVAAFVSMPNFNHGFVSSLFLPVRFLSEFLSGY